jgi:transposase
MTPLLPDDLQIFVASEPVDLRASFDRLAQIAKSALKKDPLSGGLFVFRNREGHRAKALLWDRTGWLLIYKRLENGVFHFPVGEDGVVEIDAGQLRMLLDGIELGVAPRRKAL